LSIIATGDLAGQIQVRLSDFDISREFWGAIEKNVKQVTHVTSVTISFDGWLTATTDFGKMDPDRLSTRLYEVKGKIVSAALKVRQPDLEVTK
jgi:hypothetical protein